MASPPPPDGVYVPVPTFFAPPSPPSAEPPPPQSSSLSLACPPLDLPTQAAHALYLARSRITGLVLFGSTGEAVHVTPDERVRLIRAVRTALSDAGFVDFPLVAGTASQSVPETVDLLRQAADAGARWGLVLTPGFFAAQASQEGVVRWFTAVADESPIPVLIYYYPGVSNNVSLDHSTVAILAAHPNIVGCKISLANLSLHTMIAQHPAVIHRQQQHAVARDSDGGGDGDGTGQSSRAFAVFTGLGQQLLPALSVGCAGAIDALAAFFPLSVSRLYTMVTAGAAGHKVDSVISAKWYRLQFSICRAEELVATHGVLGTKEAIARLRGFGKGGAGRAPLSGGIPGGDGEWEKWREVMEDLDAVESEIADEWEK